MASFAVDPRVSRRKFDAEVASLRALDDTRRRGWWIVDATFPKLLVAFVHPTLRPRAVVFGALIDFTDYDLRPLSVVFVDPLTLEPMAAGAIMLARAVPSTAAPEGFEVRSLLQQHDPKRPFVCLPGVREYHEHPAHSNDPWLAHRGTGEGKLYFILEKLFTYGVQPITGHNVALTVNGFTIRGIPT